VIGVARFSESGVRERLTAAGVECVRLTCSIAMPSRACPTLRTWSSWPAGSSAHPAAKT